MTLNLKTFIRPLKLTSYLLVTSLTALTLSACNSDSTEKTTLDHNTDAALSTAIVNNNHTTNNSTNNSTNNAANNITNPNYVVYVSPADIIRSTKQLGGVYATYYSKYIDYIAPNGKPIRIVAMDKVSDEQLLKAYNIISFYLTDTPFYKKAPVANTLANNKAVLVMPNGADGDNIVPGRALAGQPLYQNEVPVAGSKWYMNNDYDHRDASYEEIFHLVHGLGIGSLNTPGAYPALAQEIAKGLAQALPANKKDWGKKGLWGLDSKPWLIELEGEGSLDHEYIVAGIDSYYGLWEAFDGDKGMWGIYVPKNRADVKHLDPIAYKVITEFLGKNFNYMVRLDPSFNGTFSLMLDPQHPYTFKSQYYQKLRLTGSNNSNILGNYLDNIFIGNQGNNTIDGNAGIDIVQFSGKSTDYTYHRNQLGQIVITDNMHRDGTDTLVNIEILRFTDKDVNANTIK